MLRSWREVRAARRKGRRDGRAGVPALRDEAIPFELREILARAEGRVQELVRRWRRDDAELEVEIAEAERDAADAAERLAEAEARCAAARADHERQQAEEDVHLERLRAQLAELSAAASDPRPPGLAPDPLAAVDLAPPVEPAEPAEGASALASPVEDPADPPAAVALADAWAASAGRPEDAGWHGIGPVLYWAVIALILAGEFPLNAVAFRLFGESDLFTYVMTASLAVSLVAIAHFLGSALAGQVRSRAVWVFAVALVGAVAVISLIRYDYLRRVGGDLVGPVAGTLAFALINLVVFAAATGWSYLRHDPRTIVNRRAAARRAEREADRAERRRAERERAAREEARRREGERRRHALELAAERHRFELEARRREVQLRREEVLEAMERIREAGRERLRALEELERVAAEARVALSGFEGRLRELRRRRSALREELEARFRLVRAHRDRLVAAYCAANLRAREDRTTPRSFERIPPLELPTELAREGRGR
jgi:hypothetical protein